MEIVAECLYCGNKWEMRAYSLNLIIRCEICGDTKILTKRKGEDKVDTYVGSAPFPEEEKEPETPSKNNDDDYPWND